MTAFLRMKVERGSPPRRGEVATRLCLGELFHNWLSSPVRGKFPVVGFSSQCVRKARSLVFGEGRAQGGHR
jgi:hypothetical protein